MNMNYLSLAIRSIILILAISLTKTSLANFTGCTVNSGVLHFGEYSALSNKATKSHTRIKLQCTGSGSYRLSLMPSNHANPNIRELTSSKDRLLYNLFIDPSMTLIWGNGNGNTHTLAGAFTSAQNRTTRLSHNIFGSIYPSQDAYPGDYTDNLLVTISF